MTQLMLALKDAVTRGTKFTLTQCDDNPMLAVFSVSGGVSDITFKIGFHADPSLPLRGFTWKSTVTTIALLSSAVEGLPDEADPIFILNAEEWDGCGLVLCGVWKKKPRGRSKETVEQSRVFLIDAGVYVSK